MFDHLAEGLTVDGEKTAVYIFHEFPGEPKFECKPAIEANTAFSAATLKLANVRSKRSRKRAITAKDIAQTRQDSAKVIIAHCLVGWKDLKDEKGNDVPYSKERAVEFFNLITNPKKVSPRIFQEFLDWIGDEENFIDEDDSIITVADLNEIEDEDENLGKS